MGRHTGLLGLCACLLVACGGSLASPASGDRQDATGDHRGDAAAADPDAADASASSSACALSSDAAEPELLAVPYLDAGVPGSELALLRAVAECDYYDRCTPMAAYQRNECITALSQSRSWTYIQCERLEPSNPIACAETYNISIWGSVPIETSGDGGMYDPQAEATCLQAIEAEACHGMDPWWNIPACVSSGALVPCTTSSDCADASGTPSCVAGYCNANPCGDFAGACAFAPEGQPCNQDPPTLGGGSYGIQCAPGLTCAGAPYDGGLGGTCTKPADVGSPCADQARISGCTSGLVCQCGHCAIPPSEGPCAAGACKIGVAYCDSATGTCVPVKSAGEPCTQGSAECAPDLTCDSNTGTCQLGPGASVVSMADD